MSVPLHNINELLAIVAIQAIPIVVVFSEAKIYMKRKTDFLRISQIKCNNIPS